MENSSRSKTGEANPGQKRVREVREQVRQIVEVESLRAAHCSGLSQHTRVPGHWAPDNHGPPSGHVYRKSQFRTCVAVCYETIKNRHSGYSASRPKRPLPGDISKV
jgi:hypothetical protein